MDAQQLRAVIMDAFSSTPHPGMQNTTEHSCGECDELRNTFGPMEWEAIPQDIIDDNFGQLSLFTPEAYRYFLPAYLLRCLDNFDPDNMVCEFVIYSLTPDNNENGKQWAAERHDLLDQKQKDAMVAFLKHVLAAESFKDFHTEAADGLRRCWVAREENAI